MAHILIGREEERAVLESCYSSGTAHFVAIYGRRRVGKTYLVKTHFKDRLFFNFTGVSNTSYKRQITNFNIEVHNQLGVQIHEFISDWFGAFQLLRNKITQSKRKKKVLFIDELPWLDTRNSDFIQALEHFWNGWASTRDDILLIGCGSAASWMLNKLLYNKRGLHNRVTRRLQIEPFSIFETQLFLKQKGCLYNHYQLAQIYMVFGGIPYYLEQINPELSDVQNINTLCFGKSAFFKDEYNLLFSSLFNNAERHKSVLNLLAKNKAGMTRSDILENTNLSTGGTTTSILKELEASSFIKKYPVPGKKEKDHLYKIVDFFSLFYLHHISKVPASDYLYWVNNFNTPRYFTWAGYSFELVCLTHVFQIKKALGIQGISSDTYTWKSDKAQVDLIIDRKDHVINLCEIKFSLIPFKMTKKYSAEIQKKVNQFISTGLSKNKAVFPTIITTYGLENSIHNGVFINKLTMEDILI